MDSALISIRAVIVLLVIGSSCGAVEPQFRQLNLQSGQTEFDGLRLKLAEPDDAANPKVWQGPLTVAGRCVADLSLITGVFAAHEARYAVVVTYSGSLRAAHFVDLKTCGETWPAVKATSDISISGNRMSSRKGEHWRLFVDRAPNAW